MAWSLSVSVLLASALLCGRLAWCADDNTCTSTQEDCSCTPKKGSHINLNDLSSDKLKQPLNATLSATNVTIYFSPCKSFTKGNCKDARGCMVYYGPASEPEQKSIGNKHNVTWTNSSLITYTENGMTFNVNLLCNNLTEAVNSTLKVDAIEKMTVNVTLTSKCACPGGCSLATGSQASFLLLAILSGFTLWTY